MMGKSINRIELLGNLGSDPETRFLPNGNAVVNFSLATSSSYKDDQGQWQAQTDWHKLVAFGKLAELCAKHLKKGSRVWIEGRNKTSRWEKNGQKQYKTEVVIKDIIYLDANGIPEPSNPGKQVPDLEDVPF